MGHTSATNGGPSRLDEHAPVSGAIGGALYRWLLGQEEPEVTGNPGAKRR